MKFWLTVKGDGQSKTNRKGASGRRRPLFCCLKAGEPGLKRECRLVRQPRSFANETFEPVIAVALRMMKQVCLMIWLREPKLAGFGNAENLGGNRSSTGLGEGFTKSLPGLFRQLSLFLGGVNNHRTILAAPIVALTITLSGIVIFPKDFQQVSRARAGRVVDYAGSFGVSGLTCAHVLVAGVWQMTSHIPHRRVNDARLAPIDAFHSPKAPHRDVKNLVRL